MTDGHEQDESAEAPEPRGVGFEVLNLFEEIVTFVLFVVVTFFVSGVASAFVGAAGGLALAAGAAIVVFPRFWRSPQGRSLMAVYLLVCFVFFGVVAFQPGHRPPVPPPVVQTDPAQPKNL